MKLRFLCGAHRMQLSKKPDQAINCWQNGFDTGQTLHDEELWGDALPHLGCAFETSEILMTIKAVEPQCACELFASSAALLASNFEKLDLIEQSRDIYWMAINRLELELSYHSAGHFWINQHLKHLYELVQRLDMTYKRSSSGLAHTFNQQHVAIH